MAALCPHISTGARGAMGCGWGQMTLIVGFNPFASSVFRASLISFPVFFLPFSLAGFLTSPSFAQQHGPEQCAAPNGGEAEQLGYIDDIFALTEGRIIGWRQDLALGLYGFDTLEIGPQFEQTVRGFREVTGLNIGWAALGGRTNVALIYASYRTLTLDPGLSGLVDSLGGVDADLFSPQGPLPGMTMGIITISVSAQGGKI